MKRKYPRTNLSIPLALASDVPLHDGSPPQAPRFAAGKGFDDAHMREAAPILVPIFGIPDIQIGSLLRVLYRAQQISMGFRPVVFSDMDIFSSVRQFGWVLEHHMSEYDHAVLQSDVSWEESVLNHANLVADFFRVERIVVPDPNDGYRAFLRQLRELTGAEVGAPLPTERSETTTVSGWRAWITDTHKSARTYKVLTSSADAVSVEIEGGRGDNTVVIDGSETGIGAEAFTAEARARSWPIVHVNSLEDLDEYELRIALGSLMSLGDLDGTTIVVCSDSLANIIASHLSDDRMLLWPRIAGNSDMKTISISEVELATTIRRASSALSQLD